jgi:hypothetical protein
MPDTATPEGTQPKPTAETEPGEEQPQSKVEPPTKDSDPAANFDHPAALEALLVSAEKVFGEDKKDLVDRVRKQLNKQTGDSDEILIGISEMGELLSYLRANPEFIKEIENGIVSAKAKVLDRLRSDGPAYQGSDTYSELFKSFVAPVVAVQEEKAEPAATPALQLDPKTSGSVPVIDPKTQRPAVGDDKKPITISLTELSGVTPPEKDGDRTVAYATTKGEDSRYIIKLDVNVKGGKMTPMVAIPFGGELATKLEHYNGQGIRRLIPEETIEVEGEIVTLPKEGFLVASEGKTKPGQDGQAQLLLLDSRGDLRKIFDVDKDVLGRIMSESGKGAQAE